MVWFCALILQTMQSSSQVEEFTSEIFLSLCNRTKKKFMEFSTSGDPIADSYYIHTIDNMQ